MCKGSFKEVSYGKTFYIYDLDGTDSWATERGAEFKIEVKDGFRYIKDLKKTVVSVGIDEDAYGNIVWEKWKIKNRVDY